MLTARASEILFEIKYFKHIEPKSMNKRNLQILYLFFARAEALISVIGLSSQDSLFIFKNFKGSFENNLSKTI